MQFLKAKIGICFNLATAFTITLIIALIIDFDALVSVSIVDVGWFALIGLIHFGLGNLFLYQSISYLGAARGHSATAVTPLFSLIFATLLLEETPTILVITGTMSMVGGLFLLLNESGKIMLPKKNRMLGYGFGLGTAFCWGIVAVIIKHATQFGSPFVMLTFALLFGLLVVLLNAAKDFAKGFKADTKNIRWFVIAGFLFAIGLASFYSALFKAPVIVVSPISATAPLFTILLVHLFLKRLERLTIQIVIACFLVVIGGIFVAIF